MPYKKVKALIHKFLKPNNKETPTLPIEIINEFVADFTKETKHLKTFLRVYKRHKRRKKIEEEMHVFQDTVHWENVQKCALAMIHLGEVANKEWTKKKQSQVTGKIKTNNQIYNMIFCVLQSKTNSKALHTLSHQGEVACEHGVRLQRKYLGRVKDERIKKSFEKALVDAFTLFENFTDAIKEKKYRIE